MKELIVACSVYESCVMVDEKRILYVVYIYIYM